MTALTALLWLAASPAQACDTPTTNEDVIQALQAAISAYQGVDVEAFEASSTQAEAAARCLREAMTPPTAAEFHRVRGLLAFVQRRRDAAELRFAAARVLEPDFTFPTSVVPEGNAALEYYGAITPSEETLTKVPPPKHGSIRLDGSTSRMRYAPLPVTAQFLDERGNVTETLLLRGGDPLPDYEIGRERKRGPNLPLLLIGGGLGLASGALAVTSRVSYGAYKDPSLTDTAALESKRKQINTAANASVVTGLVGAGFGAAAIIRGRW